MILLEEAYKIVMDSVELMKTEKINFTNSLGLILANDIFSDIDMPPFDKSAMDGYACKMTDINQELEVIEVIPAGKSPKKEIKQGECAQIMTGAMIPNGADCVLMVEHTEKTADNRIKYLKEKTKDNICYKAEDVQTGQKVIEKGTLIKPQHIAILASVGATEIEVYQKPKVGVISTGDEIVEPHVKPGPSKIRNSNGYQLFSQIERCNAIANYVGIASDNEEDTYHVIMKAMEENDVILLSGGVSMGEFDFVPYIMQKAGIDIKFQKIAVQPGKPTTFGTKESKRIFGLPGNPVSSYIQFELLVRPLLAEMMGHTFNPLQISMEMGIDHSRKRSERMSWYPITIADNGTVIPASYHGSAHIHGLESADGISFFPIGKAEIKKGEKVHVRLI
ncbi:MAG: molybdopterin molybdotransferase MoeA [Bacteroidetes bacterium]|jgi:molybdopterin molybdotransferase|nr:molybdopterin molybdotransferase MoeA [Bacteroidota bacterium]MBT4339102.1 molybdopterin molybdotransferase MoeA [Bacteroidota bacterium]MBT7039129.1 molybdopterin molybdotransferase MoeA [Bacteroidota bacterium]